MWLDESVFYQIYPIGFCGAPRTALEDSSLFSSVCICSILPSGRYTHSLTL